MWMLTPRMAIVNLDHLHHLRLDGTRIAVAWAHSPKEEELFDFGSAARAESLFKGLKDFLSKGEENLLELV